MQVKKSTQFLNFLLNKKLCSILCTFQVPRLYFTNIPLHCAHFCPLRINLHGKIKREITWFIQKGSAKLNTTKFQTHIPLRHCRSQSYTMGLNFFWSRIYIEAGQVTPNETSLQISRCTTWFGYAGKSALVVTFFCIVW